MKNWEPNGEKIFMKSISNLKKIGTVLFIVILSLSISFETNAETKDELKAGNEKLSQKMDQISLSNIQANLLEISQLRDSLDALKDKSLKNCQKKDFNKDQKHQCLISLKDDYQSIIENYYQARLRYRYHP